MFDTFPRHTIAPVKTTRVREMQDRRREYVSPSTPENKWFRLTPIEWLICAVACIGFAFDTYELLVLTLTVQPALSEFLIAKPGTAAFNHWIGMLFYVPAISGGIFGLLGHRIACRSSG